MTYVLTPARQSVTSPPQSSTILHGVTDSGLLETLLQPVQEDMELMRKNLKNVVGERHPMLMAAAEQIFSAGKLELPRRESVATQLSGLGQRGFVALMLRPLSCCNTFSSIDLSLVDYRNWR